MFKKILKFLENEMAFLKGMVDEKNLEGWWIFIKFHHIVQITSISLQSR
jgi:hypothetical protein